MEDKLLESKTRPPHFGAILVCIVFLGAVAYPAAPLYAQGFTQEDLDALYVNQVYRDPDDTSLSCIIGGDSADPGKNAEVVWRFFADKLPAHQIAGIIGNMAAESGVQPQRLEGTASGVITPAEVVVSQQRVGWGLVQWTPAGKIINTMSPVSTANNIDNQLRFLWDQLEGRTPSPEKSAGDQLKATTDIRQATTIFGDKYERPADLSASLEFRISAANGAFERFSNSIPTVSQPVNSPSNLTTNYTSNCESSSSGSVVDVARAQLEIGATEYDDTVLLYTDGNTEAWSADFVSWVFKESGRPFGGGESGGWRRPSVRDMQEMFKNTEELEYFVVGDKTPQPGDVAFYVGGQTPGGSSTNHVNIVIEVNGSSMTTVGGNESNKVRQSSRLIELGSQSLVGFGRSVN